MNKTTKTASRIGWFQDNFLAIRDNAELLIRGKATVIDLALICLLSEGHLLVDDVPGVGKTSLARALAASMGASWQRIQFTPDLLPSDITGVSIYQPGSGEFEFKPGPVFANIVLGDEINRASPKTQSALLEVMEEFQVTADGRARPVPRPFMVIATQNPIDTDGTYRLPEAQLDRFLLRVSVGYPDATAEAEILDNHRTGVGTDLPSVMSPEDVRAMIAVTGEVHLDPEVRDYIIALTTATREHPEVRLGASPRGSIALMRASRTRAAASARDFVLPEDVRALASSVLAHRFVMNADAELRDVDAGAVVAEILERVPTPKPLR